MPNNYQLEVAVRKKRFCAILVGALPIIFLLNDTFRNLLTSNIVIVIVLTAITGILGTILPSEGKNPKFPVSTSNNRSINALRYVTKSWKTCLIIITAELILLTSIIQILSTP